MTDWQRDVGEFHEKFDVRNEAHPTQITQAEIGARIAMLAEEFDELQTAMYARDMVETADGIVDLIYTAIGTAICYGLDLEPFWREVHRTNMLKELRRGQYKIGKPAGWQPPEIARLLAEQRWGPEE